MTRTLTQPPPFPSAPPLSSNELERAALVGDRLRGLLVALIAEVPRSRSSALSLARELSIDRNITQKVFAATAPGQEGADVLVGLPGPGVLRKFVQTACNACGRAEPDRELFAAIDQFELLIRDMGGSQSRLSHRIRARQIDAGIGDDEQAALRERLYHDMAALLNMSCEVLPFIGLMRPIPDRPEAIHGISGYGLIGTIWTGGPLPIRSRAMMLDDRPGELIRSGGLSPLNSSADDNHSGLVRSFCSPADVRVTRQSVRGLEIATIDPSPTADCSGRTDLAFAHRWGEDTNPAMRPDDDARFWSQFVVIRRPTRRLLMDVYVHRSLAMTGVPSVGAYRWVPGLVADPLRAWDERMPGRLQLELLGQGLDQCASPAWNRHAEFANHLFIHSGWSPDDFLGFRLDVRFPIWNAGYFITFDFRSRDESP